METPTLLTYKQILDDAVATWYHCTPYAISSWAVEFLFYMSVCLLVFYVYVLLVIIVRRITRKQFNTPFYNCVLILAVGDLLTVITCSRATIPTCALSVYPARYLAWEAIGVFCVDIIYGMNLVMACIRLNAVLYHPSATARRMSIRFLNAFLVLEFLWPTAMATLYFIGLVKKIWFVDVNYHYAWLPPFELRTSFNLCQLGLTFAIYCLAFLRLRMFKISLSPTCSRQEHRLLFLAVMIFLSELFFIYSSDWIGSQWGIGDDIFNAHVAYFGKPLSTGITPFFYLTFSSELRYCCFFCFQSKKKISASIRPNETSRVIAAVAGSTQSHSGQNNKLPVLQKPQVVQ